jgi:hypothetical protein
MLMNLLKDKNNINSLKPTKSATVSAVARAVPPCYIEKSELLFAA